MSDKVKHVTDTSFNSEVLESPIPVLVDYWAEWCGPCKMIGPVLDESAETYGERLSIAKINVDQNQSVPSRYHVRGIPTLMLFKNGEVVATKVGALSKAQLAAFIDANL
jgi:thioredoxin 1